MFSFLLGSSADAHTEAVSSPETSDGSASVQVDAGRNSKEMPSTTNCCSSEKCTHIHDQIETPASVPVPRESQIASEQIHNEVNPKKWSTFTECSEFSKTKFCRAPSVRAQQLPIIFEFDWMKSAPRGSKRQRSLAVSTPPTSPSHVTKPQLKENVSSSSNGKVGDGSTTPPVKPITGPPLPDIRKAVTMAGKDLETIAAEMNLRVEDLEELMANRNESVERWAPVIAKCTRLTRVGLLSLISRKCPCGCKSAGHYVYTMLKKAGDRAIVRCREHLTKGWAGWQDYKLNDELVDHFFTGQSKEAELVADILLRLANATVQTKIFCIFVKA
eukprot:m.114780 g.114780  ORF g.114780 m.114780 type:complete len:330 (+) comp17125_c0_seq1:253-1242(+)